MGKQSSTATPSSEQADRTAKYSDKQKQLDGLHEMRILIADENSGRNMMIEAMLNQSGFRNTLITPDSEALLTELQRSLNEKRQPVDLIIMDIDLEGMGWRKLCARLDSNRAWYDIPVILIASDPEWFETRGKTVFNHGVTDIIYAPLRPAHFTPRVYSALLLKKERIIRKINSHELERELAERKVTDARLQYLVNHDDLTGLYSRRRLVMALENAIAHPEQRRGEVALLHIDLDQFKVINDLEGHHTGDQLLVNVANLLRTFIDEEKVLARISADEFTILMRNSTHEEVVKLAENLRHAMKSFSFQVEERVYHVGLSIGIAMLQPDEMITASEILARADQACYVAKKHGRNMIHLYDDLDQDVHIIRDEAHWAPRIRNALTNDLYCLLFQPVINLKYNRVDHYEALIRMRDGNGGLITPATFIPVAERMGLIHDIDNWVIKQAIHALKHLPEEKSHISLNINLSSHAFHDPEMLRLIEKSLCEAQLEAHRITFEITETAAIANYEQTREMIIKLRELGCSFALDDFGVGFNSFSYLKQFPVDYLKIDGSFITNLPDDPIDQTLVKSMVEIAKTLGKKTVAEFVENEEVFEMIKEYGIDYAQGYFIGKPGAEFEGIESVSFCPYPETTRN